MVPTPLDPDRTISLADLGELIALTPSLIGFHPTNSLVVVTLRENGLVGTTVRAELPPPELHGPLVASMLQPIRRAEVRAAVVLIVCAEPDPTHKQLLHRVAAAFKHIGVPLAHAACVHSTHPGASWQCHLHHDCRGEVPADPEAAAVLAAAGLAPLESRDDLARMLEPSDASRMARLSGLLDVTSKSDRTPSAEHLRAVRAAVESRVLPSTDEEFVRLGSALADHRVRDTCLGFALDPATAYAAEKLWIELIRCLPPPERAEAASLLAACAYLRGDGALANVALDQALNSSADHGLAGLLKAALGYGMPVDQIRQYFTKAAVDAQFDITTEPTMPD